MLQRNDSDDSFDGQKQRNASMAGGQQQFFKKEEDFLYGQISGSQLQEFRVIKYNRKGKAKDRVLMIDGFNLSHRKQQENQGFFGTLMAGNILKGSKSKQKPISSIHTVNRLSVTEFYIHYREEDKQVKYKTMNPDDCSQILAKLKFLLQGQSLNKQGRRGVPTGTYQPPKGMGIHNMSKNGGSGYY